MTTFLVGTSGWHYKHWLGDFYPRDLARSDWLQYYSQHFDTVELNNSFYRQPTVAAWDAWRETAPSGFMFAVKAHRFVTHIKRLDEPVRALEKVIAGADRLGPRLGPILYQLPPTMDRSEENGRRLDEFLELLSPDHRHAIEFRHDSWLVDETFASLRRANVAICLHDLTGGAAPQRSTADLAYVRLHGPGERYSGNYTDPALAAWANRITDLARECTDAFVYFNNDLAGHAPRNATTLRTMLKGVVTES